MSVKEMLKREIDSLPEEILKEIYDFVKFLEIKNPAARPQGIFEEMLTKVSQMLSVLSFQKIWENEEAFFLESKNLKTYTSIGHCPQRVTPLSILSKQLPLGWIIFKEKHTVSLTDNKHTWFLRMACFEVYLSGTLWVTPEIIKFCLVQQIFSETVFLI